MHASKNTVIKEDENMLRDILPVIGYANHGIYRWQFRCSNYADILELELDVRPPTQEYAYRLEIDVGIFQLLSFLFLRDMIIIRDSGTTDVIYLEGTSYMDQFEIEEEKYHRMYWKQTMHEGLLIFAEKQFIIQTKARLPRCGLGSISTVRAHVAYFSYDGSIFKDIRLRQSMSEARLASINVLKPRPIVPILPRVNVNNNKSVAMQRNNSKCCLAM